MDVPPDPALPDGGGAKRAVRHAEKPREASCAFADDVARAVLDKYRALLAGFEGEMPKQTVVAGVVAVADDGSMECLALGQGTKFLCPAALRAADAAGTVADVVRDAHAEVLARRGLKRLFLEGYVLAPGTRVAFYSSTAMCGNSCLKKWAKNSNKKVDTLPHPPFHVSQRDAGQVAVTLKGEHLHPLADEAPATPATPPPAADGMRVWPNGVAAPIGTTPAAYTQHIDGAHMKHYTASCSDKLAQWCVLGLQGACNSNAGRVVPHWVVVGRKFGDATLRRALCCRVTTKFFKEAHHPLMYCTAVPLDESVYEGDEGATFASPLCLWWTRGRAQLEALDGTTGLTPDGTPSPLCRSALAALVHTAGGGESADALAAYAARKAAATAYQTLKATLFTNTKLLAPYPRPAPPPSVLPPPPPRPQKRKREDEPAATEPTK
eukprot:TRINITY_DN27965_c0_g1_i1.p1 TRINITY_DN27965_c0_g1~~TRINITY_DN27965_c0_g1_i1.p1  ORF type:complete len:437 (+),score=116.66 TRINITY_DN27965_c0_g1_i1:51-1361(+)